MHVVTQGVRRYYLEDTQVFAFFSAPCMRETKLIGILFQVLQLSPQLRWGRDVSLKQLQSLSADLNGNAAPLGMKGSSLAAIAEAGLFR